MEVVTIFDFLPHCGDVDDIFFLWFGEVRSTENTIEGDHGKSFASAACKPRQPPYLHPGSPLLVLLGVLVRWDGFSKKTMEKRSQRRVKWWLLRPCFCDLTPHCFVICDRRDRGVDSVLYTVLHASKHGRKRRDVAFFYSFNQSIRELRFHLFGFGNTVHNGSHDAKSYFHIWLHIVDALNRTTWFCSCVLSIQISIILI